MTLLGLIDAGVADAFSGGESGGYLRLALTRPEVANAETVYLMVESTVYMFGLECHRPALVVLPMVERHICETASLPSDTRHKPFRRRLAIAGGQSAAMAVWLAFDLSDTATAHRYWDSAMAASRYAANSLLLTCVLTHLSYSAAERGDPTTSWQLAHAAVSHAEPNTRAQAWTAVRAAQEAAQLGDSGTALA